MKNLLIPVVGKSTRFPNMKPKWLLIHPDGLPMYVKNCMGLNLDGFDKIYLIVLQTHLELYNITINQLKSAFATINVANKVEIIILSEITRHQPETIYNAIKLNNISGSIFIKDVDGYFKTTVIDGNKVCTSMLSDKPIVAANKSYIIADEYIKNIVEKRVISNYFCCGGYVFNDVKEFCTYYEKLQIEDNLYVSHIIYNMILDNYKFKPAVCTEYDDWGTKDAWIAYKNTFRNLFVDIDGVLVKSSSEYFDPKWGSTSSLPLNVELINNLYNQGRTKIILTTSRSEFYKHITLRQLAFLGIKFHKIIFDLYHAERTVINDYSTNNPYPAASAVNLARDADNLYEFLK